MSSLYASIATMAADDDLRRRVTACAAQLGEPAPELWALSNRWEWAAQPGWAEAYDYAVAAGNARPGWDGAVITDGMILAGVTTLNGDGAPSGEES